MIEELYSYDLIDEELVVVNFDVVQIRSLVHDFGENGKRMAFHILLRATSDGHKFIKGTLYCVHAWNKPHDLDFNFGLGSFGNYVQDYYPYAISKEDEKAAIQSKSLVTTKFPDRCIGLSSFYLEREAAQKVVVHTDLEEFLNPLEQ